VIAVQRARIKGGLRGLRSAPFSYLLLTFACDRAQHPTKEDA